MNTEAYIKEALKKHRIEADGELGKYILPLCVSGIEDEIRKTIENHASKIIKKEAVKFLFPHAKKKTSKSPAKRIGGESNPGGNPAQNGQHSG